ncbi:DNA N-6-adenine-methyltransferase [Rhizobium leguminosarum]|uniref:DNA N-6-adenine-methyltransferase n=1 Tax=Rhizobium leguminosarum TaxID=384 RepID=UPI003F9DFF14
MTIHIAISLNRGIRALLEESPQLKEHAATRNMDVHYSSKTDDWATPADFFTTQNAKYHFDLDVCADDFNHKCQSYFTRVDDGLKQEWTGNVWMNPPYGRSIGAWVKKAYESAQAGALVVCLLPSRTDTKWFHDYCKKGEIEFLKGRLSFGENPTAKGRAPFPSVLVVFRPPEPKEPARPVNFRPVPLLRMIKKEKV